MRTKYSKSFKMQAVKKAMVREYGTSIKEIATELSVGYSTLQKWIVQTRNHELESSDDLSTIEHVMTNEKRPCDWSTEQKLTLIIKCGALDDKGVSQLCREQGIFPHHVKKWKREIINSSATKVKQQPEASKMKRQIRQLQKELNRKEKALAETAALLVLQKKVNLIWNTDGDD